jgi:hypothetical protein
MMVIGDAFFQGYLDPSYYMTNQLTDRSDVYSFGVVLLELITGRQPIEAGKYIVLEVEMAFAKGGLDQIVALELLDPTLDSYPRKGLQRLLELALRCVQDDPLERPSMSEVVKELEDLACSSASTTPPDSSSSSRSLLDPKAQQLLPKQHLLVDMEKTFDSSGNNSLFCSDSGSHGRDDLPYLPRSYGSSSFDYSGSYETVSRPLNPK